MKKIILFCILNFICFTKFFACSYVPISFCATSTSFPENLVVFGKIVAIDNNGIDFEIIDVLKGEEDKTIIRIWNGVDFDCNGNFSMSAANLGQLNENLILILPKIEEKKSDWEIIGDYRRPDYFGYTPNLKVENETISGLITGDVSYPYVNEKADYTNFKNSWLANENCATVVLNTKNYTSENSFILSTLSDNKFKISSTKNIHFKVRIYNINGLKIEANELITGEFEIDLSKYSKGIYLVRLIYEDNRVKNFKILKK